jgi:hypothetical protein
MNPGRNVVNLNWGAINADSVVLVSASEYNSNSQMLADGSDQRFIGAADVTVANVTPHGPPFDPNNGVTFVVEVGWGAPLTICTDIAVIADKPDAVVYVGPQTESNQMQASQTNVVGTSIEARPVNGSTYLAPARSAARGAQAYGSPRSAGSDRPTTRHEATVTKGVA